MLQEERHVDIKMGSERGFAIVFVAVFLIISLWPLTGEGGTVRYWSLGVAAGFFAVGFACPTILRPANRLWFRFGILLGKCATPIVMALVFFLTVVPIGLIMRALGKDLLKKKIDKSATSYWIEREESVGSMKNQF